MAEPIRDYAKLAHDIIKAVGGEENVISATRCATRLRLVLKETPANAKDKISSMSAVITVVEKGGQFQVVIGTHVGDVYDVVSKELHLDTKQGDVPAEKQNFLNKVIGAMSAIFAPFVYILAASGLLQGCLIAVRQLVPGFTSTGTSEVLDFISWTPFAFLPVLIAITAAKHFKCNVYIAVTCCCALISPSWSAIAARIAEGENVKFAFFNLAETTYTSTVLPPIFLVLILSYLERFVQKKLPDVLKALGTPFLCMLIMVPATILVIGPVSETVSNALANGYNALYHAVPALAALIIGGFWQVVVVFGVHWAFNPMMLMDYSLNGCNSFQVFVTCAVVAQAAAAFGVFLKSRNKESKSVAFSAALTGVFGITEPSIYGVTLPLKKPFICACIAGGIGGAASSFFGSMYYAYAGLPGLLTVVNAINPENPQSFIGMLVGAGISLIGSVVLVQIVGFDDPAAETALQDEVSLEKGNAAAAVKAAEESIIYCPLNGELKSITEVNDPTFSGGILGQGVAVFPSEGKLYAPFDGTVSSLFDTQHAIGLMNDSGVEMLIHIGLETVSLGGKYFDAKVKTDDTIKKGDLLIEFNLEEIKKDYDVITPVLITNAEDFKEVVAERTSGTVKVGEPLIYARQQKGE